MTCDVIILGGFPLAPQIVLLQPR